MSDPMQTNGAPSWLELHTPDVETAKKFYAEVLGWQIQEMEMANGGSYTGLSLGDGPPLGGIIPSDGRPTRWLTYLTVDDVDARTALAAKSGGSVLAEPASVPGVGRMATIEDPTGAAICLIAYEARG